MDGHEHPHNVLYRKRDIQEYLKLEYRCFCWIVLNETNVKELEEEDNTFLRKYGFKFVENGNTFYEFHVDDYHSFQNLQFGAYLSKRKKLRDKPVIMIGQDEAIFKQYLLTSKHWMEPDGTTALSPKDEGHELKVSCFVS